MLIRLSALPDAILLGGVLVDTGVACDGEGESAPKRLDCPFIETVLPCRRMELRSAGAGRVDDMVRVLARIRGVGGGSLTVLRTVPLLPNSPRLFFFTDLAASGGEGMDSSVAPTPTKPLPPLPFPPSITVDDRPLPLPFLSLPLLGCTSASSLLCSPSVFAYLRLRSVLVLHPLSCCDGADVLVVIDVLNSNAKLPNRPVCFRSRFVFEIWSDAGGPTSEPVPRSLLCLWNSPPEPCDGVNDAVGTFLLCGFKIGAAWNRGFSCTSTGLSSSDEEFPVSGSRFCGGTYAKDRGMTVRSETRCGGGRSIR